MSENSIGKFFDDRRGWVASFILISGMISVAYLVAVTCDIKRNSGNVTMNKTMISKNIINN